MPEEETNTTIIENNLLENPKDNKPTLYCSFCGKNQYEVKSLIAGPTVFICDECVILCNEILDEKRETSKVKVFAPEFGE